MTSMILIESLSDKLLELVRSKMIMLKTKSVKEIDAIILVWKQNVQV